MSNTNIQDAYESVRKFNLIAGNMEGVDTKSVASQIDFIKEELEETYSANFLGIDAVELLDGACDLFVTVSGLMQKLEAAGFNVEEALARVCENNLSKLPDSYTAGKVGLSIIPEGAIAHATKYGRMVFKRAIDGKVMKPTNFVPVNLEGLAPEGFF